MEEAGEFTPNEVTSKSDPFEVVIILPEDEGRYYKLSEHLNTFNNIPSQLESVGVVRMEEEDKAGEIW